MDLLCLLSRFSCVRLLATLWTEPTRLLCPWDSPGKNTGMGCHFLFQEIVLTQGSNPQLLYWQVSSLPLNPPGKPNQLDIHMQKNEVGSLPHIIYKNQLTVDQRPKCKSWIQKTLRRNIRVNHNDFGLGNDLLDRTPKAQTNKKYIRHQSSQLLCFRTSGKLKENI